MHTHTHTNIHTHTHTHARTHTHTHTHTQFRCGMGTGREGSSNSRHSCPVRPRPLADDLRPSTSVTLPYMAGLSKLNIRWIISPVEMQMITLCRLLICKCIPKTCPIAGTVRSGLLHSLHRLSKGLLWTDRQMVEAQTKWIWLLPQLQSTHWRRATAWTLPGHGTGLPSHTTTRCLLESWHSEKHWQLQRGKRNMFRGVCGSISLTSGTILVSLTCTHITYVMVPLQVMLLFPKITQIAC